MGGVSCPRERRSPAAPHLRWGSPNARCARGARSAPEVAAACGRTPPRHPPQQAGHPWQSPPYLLCCLLALGLPTATLLSRWLTARDLATGSEPAVQATPPCAAPSRAPAFLFLLLSAQAPAQHVSRAARLPGSLESRLPPHPRPGAARRPSRRSPRVLALIHTEQLCPGRLPRVLPSFRPARPPSLSAPAPGSSLPSCPLPPPLRGLGRPLPMRLGCCAVPAQSLYREGRKGRGAGGREEAPSAPAARLRAGLAFPDREKALVPRGAERLALPKVGEREGARARASPSLALSQKSAGRDSVRLPGFKHPKPSLTLE